MDQEEHGRNLYAFLELYLVLGFAFLGFLFCLVTGFYYHIGSNFDIFVFVFFFIIMPDFLQGLVYKINNLSRLSFTESDKPSVYIKKDYSHPIYFYINLCMNITMSTGFGVIFASILFIFKK